MDQLYRTNNFKQRQKAIRFYLCHRKLMHKMWCLRKKRSEGKSKKSAAKFLITAQAKNRWKIIFLCLHTKDSSTWLGACFQNHGILLFVITCFIEFNWFWRLLENHLILKKEKKNTYLDSYLEPQFWYIDLVLIQMK